jgi:patatin-like phospholipase/acyl hydrolase
MSEKLLLDVSKGDQVIYGWPKEKCWIDLCSDGVSRDPFALVQEEKRVVRVASDSIHGLPKNFKSLSSGEQSLCFEKKYVRLNPATPNTYSVTLENRLKGGMFSLREIDTLLSQIDNSESTHQLFNSSVCLPTRALNQRMTERNDGKFKILAIDGGGIRGIIPARILVALEEMIGPIHETFDLIAGTSTGGLIGLGLARSPTPLTARAILELYVHRSDEIFTPNRYHTLHTAVAQVVSSFGIQRRQVLQALTERPIYSDVGIKAITHEMFRESLLRDTLTNVLIPAVEVTPGHWPTCSLFHNLDSQYCLNASEDVAMATAAAPTYFPHKKMGGRTYIDGGLIYNNPALVAAKYAQQRGISFDNQHLLSLGTGYADVEGVGESHSLLFWAKNIYPMIDRMTKNAIHAELTHALGDRYVRIDPVLDQEIGLDDTNAVSRLLNIGAQLVEDQHEQIRNVARILRPDQF